MASLGSEGSLLPPRAIRMEWDQGAKWMTQDLARSKAASSYNNTHDVS